MTRKPKKSVLAQSIKVLKNFNQYIVELGCRPGEPFSTSDLMLRTAGIRENTKMSTMVRKIVIDYLFEAQVVGEEYKSKQVYYVFLKPTDMMINESRVQRLYKHRYDELISAKTWFKEKMRKAEQTKQVAAPQSLTANDVEVFSTLSNNSNNRVEKLQKELNKELRRQEILKELQKLTREFKTL